MKENLYSVEALIHQISKEFNGILRANLYEIGLKDSELDHLRRRKRELRNALKNCGIGDAFSKKHVINTIKDILTEKLNISSSNIDLVIPFEDSERLSIKEKFDIILFNYKKKYNDQALTIMLDENGLLEPISSEGGFKYKVTCEDIEDIYYKYNNELCFTDKLAITAQRIYEDYRGLGVIDEIRDMNIDGVSGGVSGCRNEFDSVWVFVKGKTIHLEFLDFETEGELQRICMNCYKYGHPGQLSMSKGYIVNEMADHSRVVVVRPPFAESFAFFIRKFDTIQHKTLEELIIDTGADIVINVLKWIVKGCQVTAVTGAQGSGKTTLLMALIGYIHPAYTLRIQEMSFELHLREVYRDRNILTFQETNSISGQEGLDLQKKTDGVVNILGEVATAPVASWLVQMSMVGSLFTMFTHHARTTDGLIKYLRNSLMSSGSFNNEMIAEEQVIDTVRFDIHLNKDIYGHRYIERVSEIIPHEMNGGYKVNNLIVFNEGMYVKTGDFSENVRNEIMRCLTESEREQFNESTVV